jgi:hypothetical protein
LKNKDGNHRNLAQHGPKLKEDQVTSAPAALAGHRCTRKWKDMWIHSYLGDVVFLITVALRQNSYYLYVDN